MEIEESFVSYRNLRLSDILLNGIQEECHEEKQFTPREIQVLKNNPYTYRVTEYNIFYTKEFKEEFWRRYQEGESPRMLLEAFG